MQDINIDYNMIMMSMVLIVLLNQNYLNFALPCLQGFSPLQEAHLYLGSFPHMPRYGAVIKSIEI